MTAEEVILQLKEDSIITLDKSFQFVKFTSSLLNSDIEAKQSEARTIIVHALDQWLKIPEQTHCMWLDLVESSGFYPYLAKESSKLDFKSLAGEIRKGIHHSEHLHGKFFHEEQLKVLNIFNSGKNLIVSAPTSFGKSLLIEEIVARKEFKNILIIQPTLALLEETRKNLKKYKDHYKLIVKTSQQPSGDGNNIFLLTAERVTEYAQFPKIEVLIVDEFYKISNKRKDERADTLNVAFYRILKEHKPHFYLLGPNIDSVSPGFSEAYNVEFYKTDYSLVAADVINLKDKHSEILAKPLAHKAEIEKLLFETLLALKDEQTLIYCSSPERARMLSRKFLEYLKENNKLPPPQELPIIGWIKQHVHPKWSLCESLEFGVGVHDAALPRHVSSSIVHQFNKNRLSYIFCTSTIIEGVNTSAKNVVLFDKKRGLTAIDFFDYSNIKGRAGRLMVHYVGRVFNFHTEPKAEKVDIDFPFFDQSSETSREVLIQIDKVDIKNKDSEIYKELAGLPEDQKALFKKNGVSVLGQKKALNRLMIDILTNPEMVVWSGYPSYEQLNYAIELATETLKRPSESLGFSASKVTFLVNKYASSRDILLLVRDEFGFMSKNNTKNINTNELIDDAVRVIFQFQRHWLEYTLPKWFHVLNSLQMYAAEKLGVKAGNYSFYASGLENDFINPRLTFLVETGLPRSAVTKIEANLLLREDQTEDEIVAFIRKNIDLFRFTDYEKERIIDL
jgi:hypothetical protein